MRKLSFIIILAATIFSSCNNSNTANKNTVGVKTDRTHTATVYQCPMDPHIIKDEAGSCPICEMDLEQKNYHEALVFLSDFKKENPDYKEGDEILKDLENH